MDPLKNRMMAVLSHGRRLHGREPRRAYDNVLVALSYFYSSGRYASEKKLKEMVELGLEDGYTYAFLEALDIGIKEMQNFRDGLTVKILEEELNKHPTLA